MSTKQYVIRRKITHLKPTPIPESTYKPETFVERACPPSPIKASLTFEKLAQPKPKAPSPPPSPPPPQFENPPPEYEPVDFRANAATLQHDAYIIRLKQQKEAEEKAVEPTQFLEWQEKMRAQDEAERNSIIQERHADLDHVRHRAIKARKKAVEARLALGHQMREDYSLEIEEVKRNLEKEKLEIRKLKSQLRDLGPRAVARVHRQKVADTKELKKQIKSEMRLAARQRQEEVKNIKANAAKVRSDVANHVIRTDKYTAKREITETKFLAALSDEEATSLVNEHSEAQRVALEAAIEKHRELKDTQMDKLVTLLEEVSAYRDSQEAEHVAARKTRKETEQKEKEKQEEIEEQKMLALEKKLEKKRTARIKEAEEMEEHTRAIAARNRYLALNKKALATKTFESQQDAQLRAAKERQMSKMGEEAQKQPKKTKKSDDLGQLKTLLGL